MKCLMIVAIAALAAQGQLFSGARGNMGSSKFGSKSGASQIASASGGTSAFGRTPARTMNQGQLGSTSASMSSKFGGRMGGKSQTGNAFGQVQVNSQAQAPAININMGPAPTVGAQYDYYSNADSHASSNEQSGEASVEQTFFTIASAKFNNYCLDATDKKIALRQCVADHPAQAFSLDLDTGLVTIAGNCISSTLVQTVCSQASMATYMYASLPSADGTASLLLNGKCARGKYATTLETGKCGTENSKKQRFNFSIV